MPRVSVIINTFNSARYLRETLDSLRAQTFAEWEAIVWDNLSRDDTTTIVRDYGDPRLRLFVAPESLTLAEGRNRAMAEATGEWLAYLDHDDLWLPHKLQAQLDLVDAAGDGGRIGLVYARTRSFSARGDEGEMIYRYAGKPLPEGNILVTLLREGCIVPLVSALVRRTAWERVGPIPSHFRFAEDYWLFAAVAELYEVRCVQETCCRYRVHPESATALQKPLSHLESLEILEQWRRYLRPRDYRRRRRVCQTLLAVELAVHQRRPGAAFIMLIQKGSVPFLIRGTFSQFVRRILKRRQPVS